MFPLGRYVAIAALPGGTNSFRLFFCQLPTAQRTRRFFVVRGSLADLPPEDLFMDPEPAPAGPESDSSSKSAGAAGVSGADKGGASRPSGVAKDKGKAKSKAKSKAKAKAKSKGKAKGKSKGKAKKKGKKKAKEKAEVGQLHRVRKRSGAKVKSGTHRVAYSCLFVVLLSVSFFFFSDCVFCVSSVVQSACDL